MPSKPNYNFQRAERDRAKKAAKEAKLQERKEQVALRKASETSETEIVIIQLERRRTSKHVVRLRVRTSPRRAA